MSDIIKLNESKHCVEGGAFVAKPLSTEHPVDRAKTLEGTVLKSGIPQFPSQRFTAGYWGDEITSPNGDV